jgi:DNA-binding CsgD family transcriptional regulator
MNPVRSVACDDCGLSLCDACQRGVAAGLTVREIDVIRFLALEWPEAWISRRMLSCAETTTNRIESIRRKLGVRTRTEIIGWAIGAGVVPFTQSTAIFKGSGITQIIPSKARTA